MLFLTSSTIVQLIDLPHDILILHKIFKVNYINNRVTLRYILTTELTT